MSRDPRIDPRKGDKLVTTNASGTRQFRQIVERVNNDIVFLTQGGKKRKCWLGAWLDWAREAEVET